jgi:hypothetical protein
VRLPDCPSTPGSRASRAGRQTEGWSPFRTIAASLLACGRFHRKEANGGCSSAVDFSKLAGVRLALAPAWASVRECHPNWVGNTEPTPTALGRLPRDRPDQTTPARETSAA